MSQFLKVKTAEDVLLMVDQLNPLPAEVIVLEKACGRFIALDILAPEPVPHFARATMDGFAVRAGDTFGASESLPALLEKAGEVLMGRSADTPVARGRAVGVPTGGMLPCGADAVVMVEYTQPLDASTIEVTRPVAPGENVLQVGEDIRDGARMFARGWRLRAQDIGVLAAVGITEISVFRRPRVALISTGDEIVPVNTHPLPAGRVRDINSFALAAEIENSGAEIGMRKTIQDRLEDLVSACQEALTDHDMIVLSGGSSVGARDYTIRTLERLPDSRLLVHGVAIRPGKPVILGFSGEKIFWGLPGQPVSALITFRVFVAPSLAKLQGGNPSGATGQRSFRAVLTRRLPSVHGRTDFFPVIVSREADGTYRADPVFGKSGAISILARADGYVIVPTHVEGYDRGTEVSVYSFS